MNRHGGLSGRWGPWDKKCLLFFSPVGCIIFRFRFLFGFLFSSGVSLVVDELGLVSEGIVISSVRSLVCSMGSGVWFVTWFSARNL